MNLGVLFSGGKDSVYATYLVKKSGHKVKCLISLNSKNKYSYMFHTPSISNVEVLSKAMNIPILIKETSGIKELELEDLEDSIREAKQKYEIEGIVTGAVLSMYQKSRIEKICKKMDLKVLNPLWQKDQVQLIKELIENRFDSIVVGVAAYPLDKSFLGKKIDKSFLDEIVELNKKYGISCSGEGGEYESFVIDCSLFDKKINIIKYEDFCDSENSCHRELRLEII